MPLPEAQRKRLLRRVDWRFLLPAPEPACALCLGSGELADAVALVSRSVAPAAGAAAGSCDLAVLAAPDADGIARAWAALAPGGVCYVECGASRGPARAEAAARALTAAGFEAPSRYAPWPSLAEPRVWLPLDAPWALRYYFRRRAHAVRHPLRRLQVAVRHLTAFAAARAGVADTVCLLARKPAGARAAAPAGPTPLELLRSGWTRWGLGAGPEALSWLLLTETTRTTSRVIGLVFAGTDPEPRAVVKMARVPETHARLAADGAALAQVHAQHPRAGATPRPLFHHAHSAAETVARGRQLDACVSRGSYPALARLGTHWLADLGAASTAPAHPAPWPDLMRPAFEHFVASYGPVLDPGMVRATHETLAAAGPLPQLLEHRDFGPWNLYVTPEGELAPLDWEVAEPRGLPVLDLVYYLGYLATKVDRAARIDDVRRSYRAALDPRTYTGAVQRACVREYAERLGLDDGQLRTLRVYLWVLHARSEYARFVGDAGGPPPVAALRTSQLVPLWEEEVRANT